MQLVFFKEVHFYKDFFKDQQTHDGGFLTNFSQGPSDAPDVLNILLKEPLQHQMYILHKISFEDP